MGNLNYPKAALLYNTLTAADIGFYYDEFGYFHAIFKDHGIDIIGGNALMAEIGPWFAEHRCAYSCTDEGELRAVCLELAIPCPCEECNFEWGVTINNLEKTTGYVTNFFAPPQKYYGDVIPRVECDDGYINATYLIQMEDSIIRQITADEHAYVSANRAYLIEGWDGLGAEIVITLEDGTTITLSSTQADLGDAIAEFEDQLDDAENTDFTLSEVETDDSMSIAGNPGVVFTISVNDGFAGAVTRTICFQQLYADMSFSVEFPEGTATKTVVTEGRFPALTGSDVFRQFAASGHHGDLSQIVAGDKPDPNANYCLFQYRFKHDVKYDLVGASHLNQYYQYVDVYINEALIDTNLWYTEELADLYDNLPEGGSTSDYNASADLSIEDMVFVFCLYGVGELPI